MEFKFNVLLSRTVLKSNSKIIFWDIQINLKFESSNIFENYIQSFVIQDSTEIRIQIPFYIYINID